MALQGASPAPAPTQRPVFVWVLPQGSDIRQVHCEDYDYHNRLRFIRTPLGWRVLPCTPCYDALSLPTHTKKAQPEAPEPQKRRRGRRPKAKIEEVPKQTVATPPKIPTPPRTPTPPRIPTPPPIIPTPPRTPTPPGSPTPLRTYDADSWSVPDIEARIPSHTIRVPPRDEEPSQVPSALQSLLAVAQLEFERGTGEGPPPEFDVDEAFVAGASTEGLFDDPNVIDADELLESLVEKGCEDHAVTDATFRPERITAGDYDDDDEDTTMDGAPVSDVVRRLERSLESPGRVDDVVAATKGLLQLSVEPTESIIASKEAYEQGEMISEDAYDREAIVIDREEPYEGAVTTEDVYEKEDGIYEREAIISQEEYERQLLEQEDEHFEAEYDEEALLRETDDEAEEATALIKESTVEEEEPIDDIAPTDLSLKTLESIDDEMPKDLSCRRRATTPSPKRIESPRPPSRSSDAAQSPQPSGIPAAPSSPETAKAKSPFLEAPSPRTRFPPVIEHQSEPLDLGKSRKSASPTVSSCSEDARRARKEYDPPEKKSEVPQQSEMEPSNLKHTLIDMQPNQVQQIRSLMNGSAVKVPDPLVLPVDKLYAIMGTPSLEIPKLLSQSDTLDKNDDSVDRSDVVVIQLADLETAVREVAMATQTKNVDDRKRRRSARSPSPSADFGRKVTVHPAPSSVSSGASITTPPLSSTSKTPPARTTPHSVPMRTTPLVNYAEPEPTQALWHPQQYSMELLNAMLSGYPANDLPQMLSMHKRYNDVNRIAVWQMHTMPIPPEEMVVPRIDVQRKTPEAQHPYKHSRGHSAARTSPIARGYHQHASARTAAAPYRWAGFPGGVPPQLECIPGASRSTRHHRRSPPSPYIQSEDHLGMPKPPSGARVSSGPAPGSSHAEQRPRITVKSLRNLCEPSALGVAGPIPGPALRSHEPDIGGSTHLIEDIMAHDAQQYLWSPMVASQMSRAPSHWKWNPVAVNGD